MIAFVFATSMEMRLALSGLAPENALAGKCPQGHCRDVDLAGHKAVVMTTGVSVVNAALGLGELLARHQDLTGVVNMGLAGSFDLEALPLGAIAMAASETWPDYGLLPHQGAADPEALGFPLHGQGQAALWASLVLDPWQSAGRMGLKLSRKWIFARCATVSGVSADPAQARKVREQTNADLENMEGFALALGCARAGLPFLEIRTVSNAVGTRPPYGWDLDGALAALGRAAATLLGTTD